MLRLPMLIGDPGTLAAMASLLLEAAGPDDLVGFSGAALAIVGTLLTTVSGVVLHQTRALDKEREKVLEGVGARLADRDRTIEDCHERIAYLEERLTRKDEQIFRLLGLAEGISTAAETLAPLAPLARRASPRGR